MQTHSEGPVAISRSRLAGKHVLITGATGGIGRALVAAFSDAQARTITGVVSKGDARFAEGIVRPETLDITDEDAVAAAAGRLGPDVDILINNAGVNGNARFVGTEEDVARHEMEVNYFGTLRMIRAFVPFMQRRGSGTIVNIMSIGSHMCYPTMGSYCASKAALHALTQALRAEISRFGIKIVGVFPPAVDTQMTSHLSIPKIPPAQVAAEVVTGILEGRDDIFVGEASKLYDEFRRDPKLVEQKLAARIA